MARSISGPTSERSSASHSLSAMRECMSKAGRAVTGGLDVRTDVKIARWPDRYMDKRGEAMWRKLMGLLEMANGTGARILDTTVTQSVHDRPEFETAVPNSGQSLGVFA
jgi:hypothetical protein